jgi:predicted metal-binding protein
MSVKSLVFMKVDGEYEGFRDSNTIREYFRNLGFGISRVDCVPYCNEHCVVRFSDKNLTKSQVISGMEKCGFLHDDESPVL